MAPTNAFTFLPLGAIIQDFKIGNRSIVQGFPTPALYAQYNSPYFGETIGRIANRVSGAKLTSLNGTTYELAVNNGPNSLHGGNLGWGKREWEGPVSVQRNGKPALLFTYVSADGEEGYPGTVEARVWYTPEKEVDGGVEKEVLGIEFEAELVGDGVEETAVNMTNHSYFILSDKPTITGTQVTLLTNQHQLVDSGGIPTGPITPHPSVTPNTPFTLGDKDPDIDDCFIINPNAASSIPIDTRAEPLQKVASFYHPDSKINLEILTTEPAFQFYTGKYIDVPAVEGLPARGPRSGFCVEPSRYVNAVNVPEYRGQVVLRRGERYGAKIVYRGWEA